MIGALVEQEALQLLIAGQLMGIGGTHTVVRLDHHRIAHLVDELPAAFQVVHHVVTGGGDAGLLVILLHLALVLDAGHILGLETGLDVEVRAQGRIPLQPVLIVGFQPVDAAILEGEERHRPVDLVIILQTADLIVFVQAVLQLRLQLIIGLVADAQHVHAVIFQLPAELPVVGGEIGGDKDKVAHCCSFLFHTYVLCQRRQGPPFYHRRSDLPDMPRAPLLGELASGSETERFNPKYKAYNTRPADTTNPSRA